MDVFIQSYHRIVLLGFGVLLPHLVCACAIAILIEHGASPRERMAAFIAGHPFLGRLVFSVLLAGFISYGSTKDGGGTNAPPPRLSAPAPRQAATPPESVATVTSNELVTGWRLLAETETGAFAEVPEGAITNEFWHRRGAFDDARGGNERRLLPRCSP